MSGVRGFDHVALPMRDTDAMTAFYTALGWEERPGSNDEFAAYDVGTVRLALDHEG